MTSPNIQATSPYLMPAEWAPHRATWIAWPHLESDFPGKLEAVRWAFCELIRHLSKNEVVEVLCSNETLKADLLNRLERSGITKNVNAHICPYERTWLRDSAPTLVANGTSKNWIKWNFNAWALYDNFGPDQGVPSFINKTSKLEIVPALRSDNRTPLVLEGGAFDVDGEGSILVTEQCLLSDVQERNPGFKRADYEQAFSKYLGATNTIWLSGGCEGDDTHGHIDDIARFVGVGKVVVASAEASDHEQFASSQENIARLRKAKDVNGNPLVVVEIPYPSPIFCDGVRLPASYLNFYIANDTVLVPTFNDEKDRLVLGILADLMPDRKVIGINCVDWVLGYGSLHCSTQQEPLHGH